MQDTSLSTAERVLLALVLAVSLFLRLTALDVFVTPDEERWRARSIAFAEALRRHDWAQTYQSGHPGVVTMWLGAAAQGLQPLLERPANAGEAAQATRPGADPEVGAGVPPLTVSARGLLALVTWLGILALYPLLRRLFEARAAFLATAFVALDPFYLAHSRLHHLDALLATFVAISVVCLLVYEFRGRRWPYLVASAAAAGLALANKSPGVLLLPWAGLVFLARALVCPQGKRLRALLSGAGALALWGLVAAAVLFAVWPAMWVQPLQTLGKVFGVARYYAETPHENSNFFWFAARRDPGPAFYPLVWAFRTTPWVLLGLAALAALWREQRERLPMAMLALAALVVAGAMTVGEKKFDRYLLPAFPMLDVLAALGWAALARRWRAAATARWAQWGPAALACTLAVGQFAVVWPTRPYYISYYNPMLGGGRAAARVMLVGWDEGLDQAATYLNAKPNAAGLVVSCSQWAELRYYFKGRAIPLTNEMPVAEPDYYLLYRSTLQRDLLPEISRWLQSEPPEYVVTLNGLEYVWVYKNALRLPAEDKVLAQIKAEADPSQDMLLLDVDAAFWRQQEISIPCRVLRSVAREDAVRVALQALTAGRRRVWYVRYPDGPRDLSSLITKQLRQQGAEHGSLTVDGIRAVRYDLPATPQFVPARPTVVSAVRYGPDITLLGYDLGKNALTPGTPFRVRLYWQAARPAPTSYTITSQLLGAAGHVYGQVDSPAQGGTRGADTWQPGEVILDDRAIEVPADVPPGEYRLLIALYDPNTQERVPAYSPAGAELPNRALVAGTFTVSGTGAPQGS